MTELCAICEQRPQVDYVSSCLGAFSYGYCQECMDARTEPWSGIVRLGAVFTLAGHDPETLPHRRFEVWREIRTNTMRHLGKTMDDYQADLAVDLVHPDLAST